ncbi:MAG: hypothetical protein E7260_09150 [Lachnospiraceae bacterium]|nr:hypothetical protein [Lachnospiraceae bacterium]
MNEVKSLPRMLSIKDIQSYYIRSIGYKKLKCFLLAYVPYQKIGNTYYFSRKRLEELLESEDSTDFQLGMEDYGYKNN